MKPKLVNLTGHEITIYDDLGNSVTLPPGDKKFKVDTRKHQVGYIAKFPVQVPVIVMNRRINKDDLPPRKRGTVYIVGLVTALSYPWRDDFIVPGTKVRNGSGVVIGCKDFRQIA